MQNSKNEGGTEKNSIDGENYIMARSQESLETSKKNLNPSFYIHENANNNTQYLEFDANNPNS